jgi:hypothetical protein
VDWAGSENIIMLDIAQNILRNPDFRKANQNVSTVQIYIVSVQALNAMAKASDFNKK